VNEVVIPNGHDKKTIDLFTCVSQSVPVAIGDRHDGRIRRAPLIAQRNSSLYAVILVFLGEHRDQILLRRKYRVARW